MIFFEVYDYEKENGKIDCNTYFISRYSNCERISDYDYAYQYVLNMGYNPECEEEKGFAFFFHCFRINRTYTGGCVGVPENIMKFIMQHIKPGCKITIDSLEHFGGDLDA